MIGLGFSQRHLWLSTLFLTSLLGVGPQRVLASVDQPKPAIAHSSTSAAQTPSPQSAYSFRSNVIGASFVRFENLPVVTPAGDGTDDYCGARVHAKTSGGRFAEQRGWRVVNETPYHGLNAVLIIRGYDAGTSSHCFSKDANLAFFEDSKLLAVLYSKGKNPFGMNMVETIGGHLRVWDDLSPVGQVSVTGTGYTFDKITGSDAVCGGRYHVPAVFGLPYSRARQILGAAGWLAVGSSETTYGSGDRTLDYRGRFPETNACSGTGYAYCAFGLRAKNGAARMGIVTAGEADDPSVVSYGVSCDGRKR